ncbi:MAG: ATP-dependent helicase HrpB [Pseudomonadota bacterium]
MSSLPFLPIDDVLPQLGDVLSGKNAAVLVAEPGAGKTTRVPLYLLKQDWQSGKILLLVPRRVAARAAAAQMSRLLGEKVGETVGYRVRMENRVSGKTKIEIITEGVFARMVLSDPALEGVSTVIFDEFHERNLDADLGLALALDVQNGLREDLRLLVMSATLDAARVSSLINNATVVSSKGRAFPVETRHLAPAPLEAMDESVFKAVLKALREETGSILAFLPGAREIERAADKLQGLIAADIILVKLYGALDLSEQDRAILPAPAGQRKIVLASAIAETSLTIEGVRVVIDSGFARVPRYNPESGLTRLETVRISQASAEQRRGRAGRLEPGICYRLWSEGQTRSFTAFNTPEILEADLSPLVLTCAAFGVRDMTQLKFLDPLPPAALAEARSLLQKLEALDGQGRITDAGKQMGHIPLPPRLAHMLLKAAKEGAGEKASLLAILLTERNLGGNATDIAHRLQNLQSDKTLRAKQALGLAQNWLKGLEASQKKTSLSEGEILSFAYPDRVALKRKDKRGEFLLANGKGAFLDEADSLSREECLVIAEAQGSETRARILMAAKLDRTLMEEKFAHRIVSEDVLHFDEQQKRVRAKHIKHLDALILDERPLSVSGEAATALLLKSLAERNLFPWPESAVQFFSRIAFLRQYAPDEWSELTKENLQTCLEDWLQPYIPGAVSAGDISTEAVSAALQGLLSAEQAHKLKAQAPRVFTAPTGQDFFIDYNHESGPVVALRVQQLYGVKQQPMLAGGGIALGFELLSPAGRPIQLTRNLPEFWRGSWADVRRDMRGRYPKHEWPEDPANALPTARAKPRKE